MFTLSIYSTLLISYFLFDHEYLTIVGLLLALHQFLSLYETFYWVCITWCISSTSMISISNNWDNPKSKKFNFCVLLVTNWSLVPVEVIYHSFKLKYQPNQLTHYLEYYITACTVQMINIRVKFVFN